MANPAFPVELALDRVEAAIGRFPKAAMFELAERGHRSLFAQLVACIVSIRTRDEESLPISLALFAEAPTPAAVAALPRARLEAILARSTFAERKAEQIQAIAAATVERFGGELPCDDEVVRGFAGVGPKCANLALGIACGLPRVSVDVHVHRVTNRWGLVATSSPEQTTLALEAVVPPDRRIDLNRLLMPFGKQICTGTLPRCSTCPVNDLCPRIGVRGHR